MLDKNCVYLFFLGLLAFLFFSGDLSGYVPISSVTDYIDAYTPSLNFFLVPVIVSLFRTAFSSSSVIVDVVTVASIASLHCCVLSQHNALLFLLHSNLHVIQFSSHIFLPASLFSFSILPFILHRLQVIIYTHAFILLYH